MEAIPARVYRVSTRTKSGYYQACIVKKNIPCGLAERHPEWVLVPREEFERLAGGAAGVKPLLEQLARTGGVTVAAELALRSCGREVADALRTTLKMHSESAGVLICCVRTGDPTEVGMIPFASGRPLILRCSCKARRCELVDVETGTSVEVKPTSEALKEAARDAARMRGACERLSRLIGAEADLCDILG